MTGTPKTVLPFRPAEVAKMYTMETAAAIRATPRDNASTELMSDITAGQIAAALLFSLRTFLLPDERKPLGRPNLQTNPNEPSWLQEAHSNSIAVRLPREKIATEKQMRTALKVIGEIAAELEGFGYRLFAGALRDYVAAFPLPRRPGPRVRGPRRDR